MNLAELLKNIEVQKIIGLTERNVNGIAFDSRKVERDSVFVAQRGVNVDGHKFIFTAIEKGASVIVCETLPADLSPEVTFIQVANSNQDPCRLYDHLWQNHSIWVVEP